MPMRLPSSLPIIDETVHGALAHAFDELGLGQLVISELAWAAYHRSWSAEDVAAWARAKKTHGDRVILPKGPRRPCNRVPPAGPWPWFQLGLNHHVVPGQVEFNDACEVVRAWLGDREVPLKFYRRAVERYAREVSAQYPNGELARAIAILDAHRASFLLQRAALLPQPPMMQLNPSSRVWRSRRRASRRRDHAAERALEGARGADPPGPSRPYCDNAASQPAPRGLR